VFDVAEHVEGGIGHGDLHGIGIGTIIGHLHGGIGAGLFPLRLEELVRNAHFHVVSFAGKNKQGFILGLPAKTGNGSVVTVIIDLALDTALLRARIAGHDDIQSAFYLQTLLGRRFLGEVR